MYVCMYVCMYACMCGMLGDLARRYDVGLVVKEGLIGRSLELHDMTESIGSVCYSNCHRKKIPRLHDISCRKAGGGSPTHKPSAPRGTDQILRGESSLICHKRHMAFSAGS